MNSNPNNRRIHIFFFFLQKPSLNIKEQFEMCPIFFLKNNSTLLYILYRLLSLATEATDEKLSGCKSIVS